MKNTGEAALEGRKSQNSVIAKTTYNYFPAVTLLELIKLEKIGKGKFAHRFSLNFFYAVWHYWRVLVALLHFNIQTI